MSAGPESPLCTLRADHRHRFRHHCLNPPKSAPIGHHMHCAPITRFSCFSCFLAFSRSSLKLLCKQEVAGSSPAGSTTKSTGNRSVLTDR
jgi:hypothetical protein